MRSRYLHAVETPPTRHDQSPTVLVAIVEAGAAIAILTRGPAVVPALVADGVSSIIGGLTGSPGETVFHFALAAAHFWLAAVHWAECF